MARHSCQAFYPTTRLGFPAARRLGIAFEPGSPTRPIAAMTADPQPVGGYCAHLPYRGLQAELREPKLGHYWAKWEVDSSVLSMGE